MRRQHQDKLIALTTCQDEKQTVIGSVFAITKLLQFGLEDGDPLLAGE